MNGNEQAMNEESIKYHITSRLSSGESLTLQQHTTTLQHQNFYSFFVCRVSIDARREWSTQNLNFSIEKWCSFIRVVDDNIKNRHKTRTQWWWGEHFFYMSEKWIDLRFLRCKFNLGTNFHATRSQHQQPERVWKLETGAMIQLREYRVWERANQQQKNIKIFQLFSGLERSLLKIWNESERIWGRVREEQK